MKASSTGRFCPVCETRTDRDHCPKCGSRTLRVPCDESEEDPLLGQVLEGRYRIDALIGRGGMGAVYRAVQLNTGQAVAVKVVRFKYARDANAARRFHRELRAVSLLSHPNTIRVLDFGDSENGNLFMVLEFLSGCTLGHLMRQAGVLPESRVAKIGCEVARSLSEAHMAELVHRDLKPDNVMLVNAAGNPDFVKVLDFGIAKFLSGDSGQSSMTRTGWVVGTPQYMAPEQASGVRELTPAVDVYALGVILYEAFSGTKPFPGDSPMAVMMAHIRNPVPELPPHLAVSPGMRELLGEMLAKDPGARPSAAVAAERLERLRLQALIAEPGPAPSAVGPGGMDPVPASPRRCPAGTMVAPRTSEAPATPVDSEEASESSQSASAMSPFGSASGLEGLTATTPVPELDDLIGSQSLIGGPGEDPTKALKTPVPDDVSSPGNATPSRPLPAQEPPSPASDAPVPPQPDWAIPREPSRKRGPILVAGVIALALVAGGIAWSLAGGGTRSTNDVLEPFSSPGTGGPYSREDAVLANAGDDATDLPDAVQPAPDPGAVSSTLQVAPAPVEVDEPEKPTVHLVPKTVKKPAPRPVRTPAPKRPARKTPVRPRYPSVD